MQHAIVSRLTDIKQARAEQMTQGPKAKPEVEKHLFYLDDLNMAATDGVTGECWFFFFLKIILSYYEFNGDYYYLNYSVESIS